MLLIYLLSLFSLGACGPATESYKDQYCTDPRTMRKHAAYTEWADAYSCTRHRCQPGGRNLAIYTVGCKRVEAPESAIECEEVVEDTNMQFPYCCTRLRCLVVVRGEVWTRVLGQPWEALPAAPWSHMYKMKRPPPADGSFLPKNIETGPVFELSEPDSKKLKLRASTEVPDCNDAVPRAVPTPDIVIALSTNSDQKDDRKKSDHVSRHKRIRKTTIPPGASYYEDNDVADNPQDMEEQAEPSEKGTEMRADPVSDERYYGTYGVTQKPPSKAHHQGPWSDIPQNQWNEHDPGVDTDANRQQADFPAKEPKPSNLQALVDAIGTRMRDIETVVQRMSEKVHEAAPQDLISSEKQPLSDGETVKHHKREDKEHATAKKKNADTENYKRFTVRNRGSKYLHTMEGSTEQPLAAEDGQMNGYFSDASNSVLRRSNGPKEPAETYMAPVDTRRKPATDTEDTEKKRKKHKKKKKHHKKHRKEDRKRFNRLSSIENIVVSLEDSGPAANN